MTHYLEFDGMNVEKAIETACKDLKTPKDNLRYDIVSYGSSGIFGLVGVKKAKIRVTLLDLKSVNVKN
jgi:spoIIIJ-associated protein